MAKQQQIITLQLISMNPDITQYKKENITLGSPDSSPVLIDFIIPQSLMSGFKPGHLTSAAIAEVARQMARAAKLIDWQLQEWQAKELEDK